MLAGLSMRVTMGTGTSTVQGYCSSWRLHLMTVRCHLVLVMSHILTSHIFDIDPNTCNVSQPA